MPENSSTTPGMASNNTHTAMASNDRFTTGGGNDVVHAGAGDDRVAGDGPLPGQWTCDVQPGDFIDGGSGGDDHDRLDLSGCGWARTSITDTSADRGSGTVAFYDLNGAVIDTMAFSEVERIIPCFAAGTRIETPAGPRAVESLRPGDLVLTLDDGPQPVRWVGLRRPGLADLVADPGLRPVEIAAHALGAGVPDRGVRVWPQHRVLFGGAMCELYFGAVEVLVPAIQMVGLPGIGQRLQAVSYVHVMFDRHQIVRTHGMWSESCQPGERRLEGSPDPQRDALPHLFPGLAGPGPCPAARMTLTAHETRVLLLS